MEKTRELSRRNPNAKTFSNKEQIQLREISDGWNSIKKINHSAQSMIDRQLTWIRYLLTNNTTP